MGIPGKNKENNSDIVPVSPLEDSPLEKTIEKYPETINLYKDSSKFRSVYDNALGNYEQEVALANSIIEAAIKSGASVVYYAPTYAPVTVNNHYDYSSGRNTSNISYTYSGNSVKWDKTKKTTYTSSHKGNLRENPDVLFSIALLLCALAMALYFSPNEIRVIEGDTNDRRRGPESISR